MVYAGKGLLGKLYSRLKSGSYIDPFSPRQMQALEKPVGLGPVPFRLSPLCSRSRSLIFVLSILRSFVETSFFSSLEEKVFAHSFKYSEVLACALIRS